MTSRDIITKLYSNKDLDDCIDKVVDHRHRQDFKQELFLILMEGPQENLVALEAKGELVYFVVRIILNLSRQTRNVFHKKFLDPNIVYDTEKVLYSSLPPSDHNHFEERKEREKKEEQILEEIRNLGEVFNTFYYNKLVDLIVEYGSASEVERRTGIGKWNISRAMKKIRTHLNDKIK